ncbi:MAG: NAD-dependent epimerase/dehydratase family protein, partial [Roseovarius sp.]
CHDPTILITGASGRIGTLLRAAWRDPAGPRAVWLARREPADILWAPGAALPDALPRCDTVIALWGQVAGAPEELDANVALVPHGAALARACGARRMLHLSSAAVYGPGTALTENAPTHPANAYGRSKLAMEAAVRALPPSATRHCCLRLANVVGADSLAPALRARSGPVRIDRFADGSGPLRSYIAPGDLARVLRALSDLPPDRLPPLLNVTAPAPVTMESLVRAAGRPLIWQNAPKNAVQAVTLDGACLAGLLPFLYQGRTAQQMIDDWHSLETAP